MISRCLHFPSYLDVASLDPSGPAQILQESHGSTNHLQYGQHVPALPLVSPFFFPGFLPKSCSKTWQNWCSGFSPVLSGPNVGAPNGAQEQAENALLRRALDVAEAEVAEVAEVLQWDGGMLFVHCLKHIFEARFSEF